MGVLNANVFCRRDAKMIETLIAGVSLGTPNLTDTLTSFVSLVSLSAFQRGCIVVLGGGN